VSIVCALGLIASAACSRITPQPSAMPTDTPLPAPTPTTGVSPAASPTNSESGAEVAPGQLRLVLDPEGSEARYRVREQLVNVPLPSDAVGVTRAVTGQMVVNADGTVVSEESMFVVDLTTLTSDESRRDNFIKSNTLETRLFPAAEFVPREALGLPSPLPASGEVRFQIQGDLTIRGITRPTLWDVTAQILDGSVVVGQATTQFTFADFGMRPPRVSVVLSVDETIRLELDFRLVPEGST
jgi:polyisoprenoid-binding protein YceI